MTSFSRPYTSTQVHDSVIRGKKTAQRLICSILGTKAGKGNSKKEFIGFSWTQRKSFSHWLVTAF